jgi:galacturonosyltransferase
MNNSKKDTILIISNSNSSIYHFRLELLNKLEKDYDIVLALPENDPVYEGYLSSFNIINYELNRRSIGLINNFKSFYGLGKIIKMTNPDLILTYTVKPNLMGGFFAKFHKIPIIMTVTGLGSGLEDHGVLKYFLLTAYRIIQSNHSVIVFQNRYIQDYFESKHIFPHRRILVNGSGVNLSNFDYLEYPNQEVLRFLYISRIMKSKGIIELSNMVQYLVKESVEFHLDIIGSMEENHHDLIELMIKSGSVHYYGHQMDIKKYLNESHVLVHPTYYEGMSNVLLEASASGRPVLASNIPGCYEIVDNGVTGLLFEPRNSQSLIDSIKKFIELPHEDKKDMGLRGREKVVKEFNRDNVVNSYIDIIESTLMGR